MFTLLGCYYLTLVLVFSSFLELPKLSYMHGVDPYYAIPQFLFEKGNPLRSSNDWLRIHLIGAYSLLFLLCMCFFRLVNEGKCGNKTILITTIMGFLFCATIVPNMEHIGSLDESTSLMINIVFVSIIAGGILVALFFKKFWSDQLFVFSLAFFLSIPTLLSDVVLAIYSYRRGDPFIIGGLLMTTVLLYNIIFSRWSIYQSVTMTDSNGNTVTQTGSVYTLGTKEE
jgi:hypothetical protein